MQSKFLVIKSAKIIFLRTKDLEWTNEEINWNQYERGERSYHHYRIE